MTQPTLDNWHPNEYTQGLRYYPSTVNLERWKGSCNTLNDLSKKTIDFKQSNRFTFLSVFAMIIGIIKTKILTKHISCECNKLLKYHQFDGSKCDTNKQWNNDKYQCEYKILKEYQVCKNYVIAVITCNDIINADDSKIISRYCANKFSSQKSNI